MADDPIDIDPHRPAWEQQGQARESAVAYRRFRAYLDLESRTLAGLEHALAGGPLAVSESRLKQLSAKYRWRERAVAKDQHEQRIVDDEQALKIRKMRNVLAHTNFAVATIAGRALTANQGLALRGMDAEDQARVLASSTRSFDGLTRESAQTVVNNQINAQAQASAQAEAETGSGVFWERYGLEPGDREGLARVQQRLNVRLLAQARDSEGRPLINPEAQVETIDQRPAVPPVRAVAYSDDDDDMDADW